MTKVCASLLDMPDNSILFCFLFQPRRASHFSRIWCWFALYLCMACFVVIDSIYEENREGIAEVIAIGWLCDRSPSYINSLINVIIGMYSSNL